jgi:hypothetical protein
MGKKQFKAILLNLNLKIILEDYVTRMIDIAIDRLMEP